MKKGHRSEGNTLGQVSMSKELLAKSKAYAQSKEIPWATWVRSLIVKELESGGAVQPVQPITPTLPARAGVRAAMNGERKCRDGKHCPQRKAANS